jgi:uncharacterized protein (TIGR03435 family)
MIQHMTIPRSRITARICILGALAVVAAFGQAPAARPEFEVASIKPSAPGAPNAIRAGLHIDGSQVSCASLSINDYIGIAYGVRNYQISGPDWMASERFDINAKLPEGASGKQIPEMLRALLEDRFQMKFHHESKDFPVYGLVVGKGGSKLEEFKAEAPAPPDPQNKPRGGVSVAVSGAARGVTVNYGNGSYFTVGDNKFEGKKLTASLLADVLARFEDRPVVDMTGLKGNYDFLLELSPEDFRAMMIRSAISAGVSLPPQALQYAESSGDSLVNAMEKLGLKLEARKAPLDVMVIDHAEKSPTEN